MTPQECLRELLSRGARVPVARPVRGLVFGDRVSGILSSALDIAACDERARRGQPPVDPHRTRHAGRQESVRDAQGAVGIPEA